MLTSFEGMRDNSRIWIYQSDRPISEEEKAGILTDSEAFLRQWAAHGSDLKASGTILYNHFLIICTDESFNLASGCSIDSSVQFVQGIGKKYGIDFFQRTNLAFWQNETIKMVKLSDLKDLVARGEIGADSLFFENTIQAKGQLETQWRVRASETWLKRYFKATLNV
ncbi:MAG: hypothetical protein Roseis2KO_29090 [Roseivirga sp.]